MSKRLSRRALLRSTGVGAAAGLAGCSSVAELGGPGSDPEDEDDRNEDDPEKIDDWQYFPEEDEDDSGGLFSFSGSEDSLDAESAAADAGGGGGDSADLGMAVGGANDAANFRRNVEEGHLPLPTDVSHEGLFYDYYFDTGQSEACSSLFCPSYSAAIAEDPFSGEAERYLTVGLNSELDASSFERKTLNLVVVLDISGSMGSSFDRYYYDRYGNRKEVEEYTGRTKMDVAAESVAKLTTNLEPDDRFGMVVFDDEGVVAKPLRAVEATDMEAIREHIRDLRARGGTNMSAGIEAATDLLAEYEDADPTEYENRTIFLTDAMPNRGTTGESGLVELIEDNAERGLYSTVIGVGLDFNTELVDAITSVRGANYYAVRSAEEFERRLDEEFEYMVTPLVFDLRLQLDAEGYELERVYGTAADGAATGNLLEANTLFPSPTRDGETRGGVILAKVREEAGASGEIALTASWERRDGRERETTKTVQFPDAEPDHFENDGVRKAVLLARYADLLQNWTLHEREARAVDADDGIETPPEDGLGRWERQSDPLAVSPPYGERFDRFADYFAAEAEAIGDPELDREIEILDELAE